jgi:hypothetical protein
MKTVLRQNYGRKQKGFGAFFSQLRYRMKRDSLNLDEEF